MELVTCEEGLWFVPLRQNRTTVQTHSVFVHKHFSAHYEYKVTLRSTKHAGPCPWAPDHFRGLGGTKPALKHRRPCTSPSQRPPQGTAVSSPSSLHHTCGKHKCQGYKTPSATQWGLGATIRPHPVYLGRGNGTWRPSRVFVAGEVQVIVPPRAEGIFPELQ